MRLVFAGTPRTAVPSLEELLRSKHEVVAALTRPDAAAGRGRQVGPSPVAEYAASAGIEVLKPASPRDPGFLDRLRTLAPGCCPPGAARRRCRTPSGTVTIWPGPPRSSSSRSWTPGRCTG